MQITPLSNITNINFSKRVRLAKDDKNFDIKTPITQTTKVGSDLSISGSQLAGTIFSLESSGADCIGLAPEIAESINNYAPSIANFSVLHPSLTSSGLFYSAKAIGNVSEINNIINKEIPSDIEETDV